METRMNTAVPAIQTLRNSTIAARLSPPPFLRKSTQFPIPDSRLLVNFLFGL